MGQFVNLHSHTSHSVRDGLSGIDALVDRAMELGQPAVAVTDHGTLAGGWKLAKAADAAGIKPIIGSELYLAIGPRHERRVDAVPADLVAADGGAADGGDAPEAPAPGGYKSSTFEHLTVLAQTPKGYRNLSTMSAAASESFWMKPRADLDLIRDHHDGLILLTGCLSGPVAGALLRDGTHRPDGSVFDGWAQAQHAMEQLIAVFDGRDHAYVRDHLFVEVMDHGIAEERALTPRLFDLAQRYGLRAVATNDSHYVHADDHDTHDMWLCIRSSTGGKPVPFTDRRRVGFAGHGYHLRDHAEMTAAFARYGDAGRTAVRQSLAIAEMIDDTVLPEPRRRLPEFPTPDGFDSPLDYLHRLIDLGAEQRYGDRWRERRPDVLTRIRHEYTVIRRLGFAEYFLLVHDVVNWARGNGIRVGPGRGSAAGSCVSYCLGIVQVDPLRAGLLFERFLDADRDELPDIDLDFDQAGQLRVFEYLSRRWGPDRVARLGTFGFARARYSLRSAARVMLPADRAGRVADGLARLVPGPQHLLHDLADPAFAPGAAIREKAASSAEARLVFDNAVRIEGVVQSEGVHACGVVIATEPLAPLVPLRLDRRPQGGWVTQWDGRDLADLGLLKLDVLGLRNLDIINNCVTQIRDTTGETVDPDCLPTDPAHPQARATWAMLSAGRTAGVFQLESSGIAKLASQVRPENLEELSALVALYRPGPMSAGFHDRYARRKHGLEEVDYRIFTDDPGEQAVLESVLGSTFGLIVYQEQLMQLGTTVAGFGPAENNRLRRAVSKKKQAEMDAVGRLFVDGATTEFTSDDGVVDKPAFAPATAKRLWDAMKGAGNYSFNKAHSYAYGSLSYITAFLKANWPAQYAAATLACTDSDERRAATLAALRNEGIDVLGPSVTQGEVATVCGPDLRIRLGLGEIKGVGPEVARAVVAARQVRGGFAGLADLAGSVTVRQPPATGEDAAPEARPITAAQLQALIESGACDDFGPRKGQLMVLPALRGHPELRPVDAEFSAVERAARERARLGTLVSESPLTSARPEIARWTTPAQGTRPIPVHKLPTEDGAQVVTLGVLSTLTVRTGNSGPRAHITLDGSKGSVDGIIWPSTLARLERAGTTPAAGDVVALRGRLATREVIAFESDGSDDDPGADQSPGEGTAEPDYVREIRVSDVYPVHLPDDSRLTLPDAPVLADLFRRAATVTHEPTPAGRLALVPHTSARTGHPPQVEPGGAAANPPPVTPTPPTPTAPAPTPGAPRRRSVPDLPPLQPTARLARPTIQQVEQSGTAPAPGTTRVYLYDLPEGANPVYTLGASRGAVLARWPGLEAGVRRGGMVTPIDLQDLRPGRCSPAVPSALDTDVLIVRIVPAEQKPRLVAHAADDGLVHAGDPESILAAIGVAASDVSAA